MKKFFRAIWFCVRWGLFIGVVLTAIAVVCVLQQLNTQIKRQIQAEFQQRFPNLDVYIGSVELSESKGIAIRRIELSQPNGHTLFTAEELFLECPVNLQAFFRKNIEISRIVLRNPILRLTRTQDGQFDELRYFQVEGAKQFLCPVEIQNGTLLYDDLGDRIDEPTKITGLDFAVTPSEAQSPTLWRIVGKGKNDFMRQFSVEGAIEPETGQWEFSGKISQLDWTADLLGFFPLQRPIQGNANLQKTLESFQGRADIHFSAVRDALAPLGCRFVAEGILDQGRAEICELGRIASDMSAKFRITDDGIVVDRMAGLGEAARFVVSYRQEGLTERRAASLAINIKGLPFDNEFVRAIHPFLNSSTQRLTERFGHFGVADLDGEIRFVNGAWKPQHLGVRFTELNFTYLEFPYSVERLEGNLRIDDTAKIHFDLKTRPGEAVWAHIVGNYENIFDDPAGQVEIWGKDIPIDAKLMKTIPAQHRQVVQSLHPTGKISAHIQLILPPGTEPLQKHFAFGLNKVAVKYDKFPYPLRDVDGSVRLEDDRWTFSNIIGTNESATFMLEGHLHPRQAAEGEPNSHEFLLRIRASELPVDGQILDALLDPNHREHLVGLRAKGKVNLGALVQFHSHDNKLSLGFRARPCPGLQICSKHFPYRIDNVQGEIVYDNGLIVAEDLRGNNRETQFSAGIRCRFSPDGSWTLRIHPMTVDQLPPSRELQDALPATLQTVFENLQLKKPFNLQGAMEFSKADEQAPMRTAWDLGVQLHQNSANLGLPVENIIGRVRLTGTSEENDFRLGGELDIASLTVYDCQAIDLRGPFFYEGASHSVFLGQPGQKVLRPPSSETSDAMPIWRDFMNSPWFVGSATAKPLSGRLFDGTFVSEARIHTDKGMSYSVHFDLIGADLAKLTREFEPGVRNVEGTINARIHLGGVGRKMEAIEGRGNIQLRNANIYEMPNMMRLLRELSIRDVGEKTGAFSSADVQFRLHGNTVVLNPLIFDGNALYLHGGGTMRLDNRTVNLMMKARLGNRRSQIPIVSPVLGGVGDQLVQMSVRGPLSEPTFSRIALPEFQKALREILGDDIDDVESQTEKRSGPSKLFPWR